LTLGEPFEVLGVRRDALQHLQGFRSLGSVVFERMAKTYA
jgi:hypothetical protein